PVLCSAGAAVAAGALPAGAPAAGVVAAPPLVLGPLQAASTPALAETAKPFRRLRRLSRAPCRRISSLTAVLLLGEQRYGLPRRWSRRERRRRRYGPQVCGGVASS